MAHWPEFDVPQAPLVCGVLQVPGDPAVESHHSPARQGQVPSTGDSALQNWGSQVNPGAERPLDAGRTVERGSHRGQGNAAIRDIQPDPDGLLGVEDRGELTRRDLEDVRPLGRPAPDELGQVAGALARGCGAQAHEIRTSP